MANAVVDIDGLLRQGQQIPSLGREFHPARGTGEQGRAQQGLQAVDLLAQSWSGHV
jgi:hypothetical protein